MHIVDGVLSAPVLIGGAAMTVAGLGIGLRSMPIERIPSAGVLSAVFFVASTIHVSVGPSSVHLMMNGLAGLVLGWAVIPALFVGLLLQAVFFGFGGVTVLGVNTVIVVLPALATYYLCGPGLRRAARREVAAIWGAVGGALSIALTALTVATVLMLSGDMFAPVAQLVLLSHLPVMAVEAALTAAAVALIWQVKPEVLIRPERTVG
ncbi:MAG: cobalt transporter CbiM [Pseudomonadota bacterium]